MKIIHHQPPEYTQGLLVGGAYRTPKEKQPEEPEPKDPTTIPPVESTHLSNHPRKLTHGLNNLINLLRRK